MARQHESKSGSKSPGRPKAQRSGQPTTPTASRRRPRLIRRVVRTTSRRTTAYAIPAAPVVELILQRPLGTLLEGDRTWGMALLLTLCVPPIIPLLIWFGLWRFNANIWWALLITLIGMGIWSIALLLWVSLQ